MWWRKLISFTIYQSPGEVHQEHSRAENGGWVQHLLTENLKMEKTVLVVVVFGVVVALSGVRAADPELTKDFAADPAKIDASFFTFTGFRGDVTAPTGQFMVKKASVVEFPGLEGQGVSYAKLSFQPGAVNAPHTHPRGTELIFIQEGWLTVGLIDTTNKLFVQKLQQGDVFAFPKGLVHYQINEGQYEVKAISAFSSSNPGTVSVPATVFGSSIDESVLSKAFKVSPDIIKELKAPFSK